MENDGNLKPPTPPDLGRGICVTFDICRTTQQFRARVHDGKACLTFAGIHPTSYGEALAKAVTYRKNVLGLSTNNIVERATTRSN